MLNSIGAVAAEMNEGIADEAGMLVFRTGSGKDTALSVPV